MASPSKFFICVERNISLCYLLRYEEKVVAEMIYLSKIEALSSVLEWAGGEIG
jgi:hypothetical protein